MSHVQAGKRQKTRDVRAENIDYFQGIDRIEYNNMATVTDTAYYRHYNSGEKILSKDMEEWLKYSVSFTEFKYDGSDAQGRPTFNRQWDDHTNTIDNCKRCIRAFYDFCTKLGVKYWTAFDNDLVPQTDNWDENKSNWDEITDYITEMAQKTQIKLLWMAPDLHSHQRYSSGAFTSNEATTFLQAASQVKKCLEVSQRLNAECFLLWPYREGYDAVFQTDVAREIKLFAKLLKITAEYRDRLSYKCQLLLMPYPSFGKNFRSTEIWRPRCDFDSDTLNRYMWDVTSCLYFLKFHSLDRYYKVCSPPGQHVYLAGVYNAFGGVTMTNTFDPSDIKTITLMLKCIIDQGSAPPGGISLRVSCPRGGTIRDQLAMYINYIDECARGLRVAAAVLAEQVFVKHVQQRYSSYYSGFGARLVSGDVSMEECEELYKKNQAQTEIQSGRRGNYELVFQRYLDACDHV
nr:xylose isomerase-like [Danaus plexippus plexippus]